MKDVVKELIEITESQINDLTKEEIQQKLKMHAHIKEAKSVIWNLFLNLEIETPSPTRITHLINSYASGDAAKTLKEFDSALSKFSMFNKTPLPPVVDPKVLKLMESLQKPAQAYLDYTQHESSLTRQEELMKNRLEELKQENTAGLSMS